MTSDVNSEFVETNFKVKGTSTGVATGGAARGNKSFNTPSVRLAPIEELAADGSAYKQELAYLMSVIASWAYADETTLAAKLRYYGIEGAHVRRVSVANPALLLVSTGYLIQSKSGKVAVLAFRGTDPSNLISVLGDAQVMQRPFLDLGNVHSGFMAHVEAIWDGVSDALNAARQGKPIDVAPAQQEKSLQPLETLYVTGHSLGGAMAMLAAARLFQPPYIDYGDMIQGIYTFGQPMVGDEVFAEKCEKACGHLVFRHVYDNDPIPHLPPRSGLQYMHVGPEWRSAALDRAWKPSPHRSGRSVIGLAVFEVLINLVEARVTSGARIGGASIDDHMPANYLDVSRVSLDPTSIGKAPSRSLFNSAASNLRSAMRNVREGAARGVGGLTRLLP